MKFAILAMLLLAGCVSAPSYYPSTNSYADRKTKGAQAETQLREKHEAAFREKLSEYFDREFSPNTKLFAGKPLKGLTFGEPSKVTGYSIRRISAYDLLDPKYPPTLIGVVTLTLAQGDKTAEAEVEWIMKVVEDQLIEANQPNILKTPQGQLAYLTDPLHKYRNNPKPLRAIQKGEIYIGMPEDAMLLSWGEPERVNRAQYGRRTQKQFVFPHRAYVYTNGQVVTAWQN